MKTFTLNTMRHRLFLVGITSLFALSVLLPMTREVQLLAIQLLLHLPGEKISVQGQPRSCVILNVPNAHLNERAMVALRLAAVTEPDAYVTVDMLGYGYDCLGRNYRSRPLAAAWASHPLMQWAALAYAYQSSPEFPKNPHSEDGSEAIEALEVAADLLLLAQKTYPDNGALWLAEAWLYYSQGHKSRALESLRLAAQKPRWKSFHRAACQHVTQLLEKEGLPRLDAVMATAYFPNFGKIIQDTFVNRWGLEFPKVIRGGKDDETAEFLSLCMKLGEAQWVEDDIFNRFGVIPFENASSVLEAIQGEPEGSMEYAGSVDGSQCRLELRNYLVAHAGEQVTQEFLAESEQLEADFSWFQENQEFANKRAAYDLIASIVFSLIHLFLLNLVPVVWLLDAPFSQCRPYFVSARFWCVAALANLAATALLANFYFLNFQPVGMYRVGVNPYFLGPIADAILMGVILSAGWFAAKCFLYHNRMLLWGKGMCFQVLIFLCILSAFFAAKAKWICQESFAAYCF